MQMLKNTVKYIFTALMLFIIFANCGLYLVKLVTHDEKSTLFGFSWAVIMSGSMEPSIEVNDLVVTKKEASYKAGDVVTFMKEEQGIPVTHRIENAENGFYTTRGDSNNISDEGKISGEDIVGRVIFIIPGIGRLIEFLKTGTGFMVLLVSGFLLIEVPAWKERHAEN